MARPQVTLLLLLAALSCSRPMVQEKYSSIAVLPLTPGKASEPVDWLCGGLTVDLIDALGNVPQLEVTAPGSSLRSKKGQGLAAAVLLQGAVDEIDGLYRIELRLLRASDGAQLQWKQLERSPAEMVRAHYDVARTITDWLALPPPAAVLKGITTDLDAHYSYWRGLNERHRPGGTIEKAIEYYQDALQRDHYFAAAGARLAEALLIQAKRPARTRMQLEKLREASRRALELNRDSSQAQTVYAECLFWFDWRWADAGLRFRDAIRLQPSNTAAHLAYAALLIATRQPAEAASHIATAERLDPLDVRINEEAIWLRLYAHQLSDALSRARAKHLPVDLISAIAESAAGNHSKAVELADAALSADVRDPMDRLFAAVVYRNAGLLDKSAAIAKSTAVHESPVLEACAAALLSDRESVFKHLERAIETRDPRMVWIHSLPMLESVKSDPRFARIVAKAGLGEN